MKKCADWRGKGKKTEYILLARALHPNRVFVFVHLSAEVQCQIVHHLSGKIKRKTLKTSGFKTVSKNF